MVLPNPDCFDLGPFASTQDKMRNECQLQSSYNVAVVFRNNQVTSLVGFNRCEGL